MDELEIAILVQACFHLYYYLALTILESLNIEVIYLIENDLLFVHFCKLHALFIIKFTLTKNKILLKQDRDNKF